MMTAPNTVDTIEDVIRILREQPEVREAVRREILTDELLELPEKVAQIIRIQQQILDRLDRQDEILRQHSEILRQHSEILRQHSETLAEHGEKLDKHSADIDDLKSRVSRLDGLATMQAAERRFELIAMEMGLDEPRMLSLVEIARLAMSDEASDYTEGELDSFRNCDIIFVAKDPGGEESYVAVQVSTTVDHNDIDRASDHARMVTRFTDKPARPAVVGFNRAGVAERRLNSGSVHWHKMPLKEVPAR